MTQIRQQFLAEVLRLMPHLNQQEMKGWLDAPEGMRRQALHDAFGIPVGHTTWKQVMVGDLENAKEAYRRLREADIEPLGFELEKQLLHLLEQMNFEKQPQLIELVNISIAELGFSDQNEEEPTTAEIYERAASLGFVEVPQETALQVILQHSHELAFIREPVGDFAMSPLQLQNSHQITLTVVSMHGEVYLTFREYHEPNKPWPRLEGSGLNAKLAHNMHHFVFMRKT